MNFPNAIKSFILRWLDFKSRSSRSEYWWAILGLILISILIEFAIIMSGEPLANRDNRLEFQAYPLLDRGNFVGWFLLIVFDLFTKIAGLALSVRRLHDTNRSGWWVLISFTIIGLIPLIYWYCTKGTTGDNKFGSDPLKFEIDKVIH